MVVDALNRVTRMHYDNMVTFRWYESIVAVTPHSGTTHDLNLIMVDGLAKPALRLRRPGVHRSDGRRQQGDDHLHQVWSLRGHHAGDHAPQ